MEVLTRSQWSARRQAHQERLRPYAEDRVLRMKAGRKHPVYDFLFEYYAFRPAQLLRWSPGFDVVLEDARAQECDWAKEMLPVSSGYYLPGANFPAHRLDYLNWACEFLSLTSQREPIMHCFGLHEWAMVYQTDDIRHAQTPLRLPPEKIAELVDQLGLRCTHYDAYRFFTPDARPKNRIPLTRETTIEHDQPGCVHVNMDLYKFGFKIMPWLRSELLADAFELALEARRLDMQASPYDLRSFGLEVIPIETRDGREDYNNRKQALTRQGQPIRQQLLMEYQRLRQAVLHAPVSREHGSPVCGSVSG